MKLCGFAKRMPHVIKQVFLFPLEDALEFQYCFFGWLLHGVMFPWPDGLVEKRWNILRRNKSILKLFAIFARGTVRHVELIL